MAFANVKLTQLDPAPSAIGWAEKQLMYFEFQSGMHPDDPLVGIEAVDEAQKKWRKSVGSIPTAPTKLLHSTQFMFPFGNNKPFGNN